MITFTGRAYRIWAIVLCTSVNCALAQVYSPLPMNYAVSLLKDINPGSGGSYSGREGIVIDNTLYFPAAGDIWKTTGTEASTVRVKDINPNGSSDPNHLTNVGGTLYFSAIGPSGREIYKSNGTAAGTVMIKDINPTGDSNPWHFCAYNNMLLFRANNGVDGDELWKTDGTPGGTVMVKNINKHASSTSSYFNGKMPIINNIAYFIANDGLTGEELWRTDGTESGTYLVKNINPTGVSKTYDIAVLNNVMYFLADDGIHGHELWRSDGTTAGTSLVKDLEVNGEILQLWYLIVVNDILFLSLQVNGDSELYRSDGTAAGTYRIKNINPTGGSSPGSITKVGNQVYFVAYEPVYGQELWKSDGTASGTVMIKDLTPNGSSDIGEVKEAHGRLFFTLESDEPYVSNGTAEGTKRIANINPDGFAMARTYMEFGTSVLFFAAAPGLGRELYKAVPCNYCAVTPTYTVNPPPVEEVTSDPHIRVLGNPVKESLSVEVPANSSGPTTLELLSVTGALVEKRQIPKQGATSPVIFDLQKQSAGLLLLRVSSPHENKLVKIVKME